MCKMSNKFDVAFDTCKPPLLRRSHIFLIINHIWSSVMNMPSQMYGNSSLCSTGYRPFGAAALLSLHFSKQGIGYR